MIIAMITCAPIRAQVNLVLNPGFESYSQCPYQFDQIGYAHHWGAIDTTITPELGGTMSSPCIPELVHTCATSSLTSVPENGAFYQYPHSGNGMSQVMMFFDESYQGWYQRDYLQGRLVDNLQAGHSYCVSFYVCLEDLSKYATNNIGAYIDDGNIDTSVTCGYPQTLYSPQVLETDIITDSLNWTKIEGTFIANGTEKFITIGNFFSNSNTASISLPDPNFNNSHFSWYLIDDVSVVESNTIAYAGNDTTIVEGDSVFIGRDEVLPDCKWYQGIGLIDSGAGIWVQPITNTSYVIRQTLCGTTTFDTVTITVIPLSLVNNNVKENAIQIYPNPVSDQLVLSSDHRVYETITISDLIGRKLISQTIISDKTIVNTSSLQAGVYYICVDGKASKEARRFVKL